MTLLTLFGISGSGSASELTESKINTFIDALNITIINLSTEDYAKALSDSASITLHINMEGTKQSIPLSKRDYISMLKQSWRLYKKYTYRRSNLKITLRDNSATVISDIHENMIVQQENISGHSREELTIELVNNKLLITKIINHTGL